MTSNRQTSAKDSTAEALGAKAPSQDTAEDARPGNTAKEEAVAASDMEAAPASQTGPKGDSFYNPALTGSGTIMPDGTYGAPLPDPNLAKLEEDPEVTTELKVAEAANTNDGTDKVTQTAAARKSARS